LALDHLAAGTAGSGRHTSIAFLEVMVVVHWVQCISACLTAMALRAQPAIGPQRNDETKVQPLVCVCVWEHFGNQKSLQWWAVDFLHHTVSIRSGFWLACVYVGVVV
jgi:hypothetical protein